jgi:hypothetical protein
MIVFLDKDGVLETTRGYLAGMSYDPLCAKLLNGLFRRPDVRVVISATVRIGLKTPEAAHEHFGHRGVTFSLHPDWRTGPTLANRSLEIGAWLEDHGNPTDYLVIDDEHCDYPVDPSKWIKCCPANGISLHGAALIDDLAGKYAASKVERRERAF